MHIPDNGVYNGDWQSVWEWRAENRLSVKDGDELVDIGHIARCGRLWWRPWMLYASNAINALSILTLSNTYRSAR